MDSFTKIIGNFALAFMAHNTVSSIISRNEKKENNSRDLGAAFIIICIVYGFIGILGSLGIYGRETLNI